MNIELIEGHEPLLCKEKGYDFWKLMDRPQYRDQQAVRDLDHTEGRTMRKRADRAARLGYQVDVIEPGNFHDDYLAINRSLPERQGRPMAEHYVNVQQHGIVGPVRCKRHHTLVYGVKFERRLVAYSTVHRVGELVMLSMFLGHGDHLDNGIMYLLTRIIADHQLALYGPGVLYYNRWDSGQDGLRFFKAKIGMHPEDVTWTATI